MKKVFVCRYDMREEKKTIYKRPLVKQAREMELVVRVAQNNERWANA